MTQKGHPHCAHKLFIAIPDGNGKAKTISFLDVDRGSDAGANENHNWNRASQAIPEDHHRHHLRAGIARNVVKVVLPERVSVVNE